MMPHQQQDYSRLGFTKTFVFPTLSIFLIPAFSLAFFLHAQSRYDRETREYVIERIQADESLSPSAREEAINFFENTKMSRLVRDETFAAQTDATLVFRFSVFRWMIWASLACLASSVGMLLIGVVCVVFSRRSQEALYRSLAVGWQVLRVFGAIQTIVQVALLMMLSFWFTAINSNVYYVQLIIGVGLLGFASIAIVVSAIFARTPTQFEVVGQVAASSEYSDSKYARFWRELREICNRVGTAAPDHVILGIDDNFFVTEQPVSIEGEQLSGRTLYVSLSLLKQLHGEEAKAVVAHEMAHFSGQNTLFSKKIVPLLNHFDNYLVALHSSIFTKPVFYFMVCFRVLFELSLGELRRNQEFRADRIAAESTSALDMATALLRIVSYSTYRNSIQQNLFNQDVVLESADIAKQIENGFPDFLASALHAGGIVGDQVSHPFDSHPPTSERLKALGVDLEADTTQQQLESIGDGRWFFLIDDAESIEHTQWAEFENRFQQFHRNILSYRYLPENDYELAIVSEAFPPLEFKGKKGTLSIDCQQMHYSAWPRPVGFHEVSSLTMMDNILLIVFNRDGQAIEQLNAKHVPWKEVHEAIGRYFGRYQAAKSYCESAALRKISEIEVGVNED